MEPTRNPSPDIRPGRAMQPGAPRERPLQRPVFNDFTRPTHRDPAMRPVTRPTAQPVHQAPAVHQTAPAHTVQHPQPMQSTHAQPLSPAPQSPVTVAPKPSPNPVHHTPHAQPTQANSALRPPSTVSDFATPTNPAPQPTPVATQPQPKATDPVEPTLQPPRPHEHHEGKHSKAKETGPKNTTGRSGAVGFISFVILCALFFLPLLPGKVLDNFPGSSASFSTGDQALSCIDTLGPIHSTVKYDTKMGFPITYNYSTTTTQTATCKGVTQTAVGGHTSQFNPLGGLIDATAAFAIAFGVAKFWRWFTGRQS